MLVVRPRVSGDGFQTSVAPCYRTSVHSIGKLRIAFISKNSAWSPLATQEVIFGAKRTTALRSFKRDRSMIEAVRKTRHDNGNHRLSAGQAELTASRLATSLKRPV